MNDHTPLDIQEWSAHGFTPVRVAAIREIPLTLTVNGRVLATLMCAGKEPRFLAAGFLRSSGVITKARDIAAIEVEESADAIRVEVEAPGAVFPAQGALTSGLSIHFPARPAALPRLPRPTAPCLDPVLVPILAKELQDRSTLYRLTRGCHNASLCSTKVTAAMLLFREDIGRHNAIDMLLGQALLEDIDLSDKMLLATGRVANEIAHKAILSGVPILISLAAATDLAVTTAREADLTLLGMAGEKGFRLYWDGGRIMDVDNEGCTVHEENKEP